jgi:hypothetical protein
MPAKKRGPIPNNPRPRVPLSLKALKRLGDTRKADARQAVKDAQRLGHEAQDLRAETEHLHAKFHNLTQSS